MRRHFGRFFTLALISQLCVGCGTVVPAINEPWEDQSASRQITFGIKRKIYCELKDAVINVNTKSRYYVESEKTGRLVRQYPLPPEWGAHISLSLTIDEKSSIVPGLDITRALGGSDIFNLGLGGEASSSATRIEKFNPFYSIGYLMKPYSVDSTCKVGIADAFPGEAISTSSPLITSELGLGKWLEDALLTSRLLPSNDSTKATGGDFPDTFSIELRFIIVTDFNVTPSFKLVRVSGNTGGSFLSSGRTRTHDLVVTIGPQTKETSDTYLALQINQALNAGSRGIFSSQ